MRLHLLKRALLCALALPGVAKATDQEGAPVMSTDTRDFGSIARAAEFSDLHPQTIRRYIRDGVLTGYRLGNKTVRVDMAELAALLQPIPTAGGAGHAAA
jgi:hypothetical protein